MRVVRAPRVPFPSNLCAELRRLGHGSWFTAIMLSHRILVKINPPPHCKGADWPTSGPAMAGSALMGGTKQCFQPGHWPGLPILIEKPDFCPKKTHFGLIWPIFLHKQRSCAINLALGHGWCLIDLPRGLQRGLMWPLWGCFDHFVIFGGAGLNLTKTRCAVDFSEVAMFFMRHGASFF